MKTSFFRLTPLLTLLTLLSCSKHSGNTVPPNITPPVTDSFFSWRLMDNTTVSHGISDIWFVSPSTGFFAGNDAKVYQSTDSGNNWTPIANSANLAGNLINLFFLDAQHGFAQGSGNLLITRDGGVTWNVKPLATSGALNIFFTTPSTGYYGDQTSGLYQTTDTGKTWTQVYYPISTADGYYPYFLDSGTGYVFAGNGVFAESVNGGSSWSQLAQITIPNAQVAYNTLQFVDSLTGFYACNDGVLRTVNGGQTWTPIYSTGSTVNIVKFFDANTGYYSYANFIYKTIDGGQHWTISCKLKTDGIVGMHFISPTTGWACSASGYILRIGQ